MVAPSGTNQPPDRRSAAAPEPRRAWSAAGWVVAGCVAVFVVSTWPTWAYPLLYSNDAPQHLLQGFVHNHFDDQRLAFERVFVLNEPLTGRGYLDVFRPLEPLLGWPAAHRATLLLAEALWCSAWATLALRLHRSRWPFALLGCATGIQWAYWIGLLPFFLGLGAAFWAMHLVLLRASPLRYLLLAAALLIVCQIHVFAVVLAGCVLLGVALGRGVRDTAFTIVAGAPSVAFSWYVSSLSGHQDHKVIWDNPIDPVESLVGRFFGGGTLVGGGLLALALFAVALAWRRGDRRSRVLSLVGVSFLMLGYGAPDTIRGWQSFGPRFLPLGFAVLFCAAPLESLAARARTLVATVVVAIAAGHAAWAWRFHVDIETRTAPVVALARQLPAQVGREWAMFVTCGDTDAIERFTTEGDHPHGLQGWLHLGQVLALDLGGRPTFSQAGDLTSHGLLAPAAPAMVEATPHWDLTWPRPDEAARRERITGTLDGISRMTPFLVFVGHAGDEALVERAGYRITAMVTDGVRTAVTATFIGCDVTVFVPPDAAIVESGAMPWEDESLVRVPDVEGFVRFRRVGCGERWVRVDGRPCGGSSRDPVGRAPMLFTDGAVIVCEPDR
jgi:hypothetical protein